MSGKEAHDLGREPGSSNPLLRRNGGGKQGKRTGVEIRTGLVYWGQVGKSVNYIIVRTEEPQI